MRFDFLRDRVHELRNQISERPNECGLWVGAGWSKKLAQLPTWEEFLRLAVVKLIEEDKRKERDLAFGLIDSGRFSIAADFLQDSSGARLFHLLKECFDSDYNWRPSPISKFCLSDVLTTNYDRVLAHLIPWGKKRSPTSPIEELLEPTFKLVYLHGSIEHPKRCVLSLSSYAKTYTSTFRWYLANAFSTKSFLFLGSSMNRSEAFFDSLALIRNSKARAAPPHFALVAVRDEQSARNLGNELEKYGVLLIPYIADENHSFVDEFLDFLEKGLESRSSLKLRIDLAREFIDDRRYFESAVHIWNLCHFELSSNRRPFGDLLHHFFSTLFEDSKNAINIYQQCRECRLDLNDICENAVDLLDPSSKAFRSLEQWALKVGKIANKDPGIIISRIRQRATSYR